MAEIKHGTVLLYNATLRILNHGNFRLEWLKKFALESVGKFGLGFRRFTHEQYPGKNSYTLVAFLNESHMALTCYPEVDLLEVELASCKSVSLVAFREWIRHKEDIEFISSMIADKDERGIWMRI